MRPLGVTLVGFYQILRGVVALVFGFCILFSAGLAAKIASLAAEGDAIERLLRDFGHLAGLIIIVVAIIDMLAGYGVLQMQNWGRLLTVLLAAIGMVLVLPGLARANFSSCLVEVLDAACILYLAMPAVRRAFHTDGNTARAAA
jgi:hypothetical protein